MIRGYSRRWCCLFGIIPLVLSISALIGWFSGELFLASFNPVWKAMAPFTAVIIFFISSSLVISLFLRPQRLLFSISSAVICIPLAVSFLDRTGLAFTGFEISFIPDLSMKYIGNVNTGVMSPLTITVFFLIAASLFLMRFSGWKYLGMFIASVGFLTSCAGVIDILGYFMQNRILQGIISFPTGIAFLFIGFALTLKADRNSFPARIILSDKSSSIFLRRIIPLVLAVICIQGFVLNLFGNLSVDSMYVIAVFTAVLVVLMMAVSVRVSISIGNVVERLIDERETARAGYVESEMKYETLVESLQEGIAVLDEKGVIKYANPRMYEFFGSGKKIENRALVDCIESIDGRMCGDFIRCIADGEIINGECVIKGDDDLRMYTLITIVPFGDRKKYNGAIAGIVDITEKKRTEEKLKESLENREVLLRELYHRTKNNMQVICAMIRLRINDITDEKSKMYFKELDNRILAMSLVHQKLYESKNLSIIDIGDYTKDLSKQIVVNSKGDNIEIKFSIDIQKILLPIECANPYGLLIAELIANSCKHAFKDMSNGLITISMKPLEDNQLKLVYSDNGRGLPADFSIMDSSTFGFRIIKNLAENQLYGSFRVLDAIGFSVEIVFPSSTADSMLMNL
jgi:PAS domain S-box-containing protein